MKLQEYISGLDNERLIITQAIRTHLDDKIDLERTTFPIDLNKATNTIYLKELHEPLVIGAIKGKPCFISFGTPAFFKNHPELFHNK